MQIKLKKPRVLPKGFQGHILFTSEQDGDWLGICLEFSLAVDGGSYEECRDRLLHALPDYISSFASSDKDWPLFNPASPNEWRDLYGAELVGTVEVKTSRKRDSSWGVGFRVYRKIYSASGAQRKAA